MSELANLDLTEVYPDFPPIEERLSRAYADPYVHERFLEIKAASEVDRPALQAQLNAYLAAAYVLFPEESQIIHDSLEQTNSNAG
ncbi:MAG TPA: hypothetical protein VFP35_00595 [Candidatus Saccharimonadales bacterium]|nr:hypothetical protein [Candidatus Saccharimonadales bacterium]